MNKSLVIIFLIVILVFSSCSKGLTSTYVGYSWKNESSGINLEDAKQKIETTLTLNKKGKIIDMKMLFWKKSGDEWYTRQDNTAKVSVDFNVDPLAAVPGKEYKAGKSMFSIETNDLMSFYAAAADKDGTVAFVLVGPSTRYQFEIKIPAGTDLSKVKVNDFTINNGLIPTIRTSKGGLIKPDNWDDESLLGKDIFTLHVFNSVINKVGVFKKINSDSTMKELLSAIGIKIKNNTAIETELIYGFYGLGGWAGNYDAVAKYLIGKNANDIKSLIDWSPSRYKTAINDKNQFGVDVPASATKTIQNSYDGIAGATVRFSRENTSYQRALVSAGILKEDEVVIGRF